MNTKDLEILKANIDNVIKIISRDGETLLAKVVLVSEDEEDVIYDLPTFHYQSDAVTRRFGVNRELSPPSEIAVAEGFRSVRHRSDKCSDDSQHIVQLLHMREMASLGDDFEATGRDAFGITATIFKIDNPVTRSPDHQGRDVYFSQPRFQPRVAHIRLTGIGQ
jgi:hypothetical protein